jgi:hypothetical protein
MFRVLRFRIDLNPEFEVIKLKVCPKCELDASNEYFDSTTNCSACGTELVEKLWFLSQNSHPPISSSGSLENPDIPGQDILLRSKKIALILAIFGGPFTWLYTYRRDAWKAAIGLGLITSTLLGAIILLVVLKNITRIDNFADFPDLFLFMPLILISVFVWLPVWLWAIVDVVKKRDWIMPDIEIRNKNLAVLLAVFLTPWSWFYTYKKDKGKFWFTFIILYGDILAFWIITSPWLRVMNENAKMGSAPPDFASMLIIVWGLNFVNFAIFIFVVVIAALRPAQWYNDFGKIETGDE